MLPASATLATNGHVQMTLHYSSYSSSAAANNNNNHPDNNRYSSCEYDKLEVVCPSETKNLWCDLRDGGKFASDVHFLSHLLKLERLWQAGSVEVIAKAPYIQDHINDTNHLHFGDYNVGLSATDTPPSPPPPGINPPAVEDSTSVSSICQASPVAVETDISCELSTEIGLDNFAACNSSYLSSQILSRVMETDGCEDKKDVVLDVKAGGELTISKVPLPPSPVEQPPPPPPPEVIQVPPEVDKFCNKTPEKEEEHSSYVRTLRPRQPKLRLKYKEHGSNSSDSSDNSIAAEDLDVYTVEIDVDQQYPSLNMCNEASRKDLDDDEDLEMRKRPLRKRLRKIVLSGLLADSQEEAAKAKAACKIEVGDDDKVNEEFSVTDSKMKDQQQHHGSMKRWSTRRLPAAASAYMKVMRIGGRISPDRRAVSSTNTLMLKAPRSSSGKGGGEDLGDSCGAADDVKQQQLSELVYCQGSREIKCPLCVHIVPLKKDFVAHLEDHLRTELSTKHCPVCELKLETKDDLLQHLQTHAEKTYKCDKCSARFSNRHRLNVHFFEHLTEEAKDDFRCDICGKPCYSRCYLQRHRRRHTGERPYMCDVCGKVYFEMSTLNTHRRSHTDERFTCDLCGNRYMQKSALNLHMKSAHEGIKEHMCEMCGKAFFDKHHLQKHIRIHTGEKPYQCEFCGKSFTQKVNRDQHRRLHTGEQPYRCEYCLRTFALRAAYTQHIRKHTGVKVSEMKRVQLEKLQHEWSEKHPPTITPTSNSIEST